MPLAQLFPLLHIFLDLLLDLLEELFGFLYRLANFLDLLLFLLDLPGSILFVLTQLLLFFLELGDLLLDTFFIFQDFNLLDTLSVQDNILLPLVLSRCSVKQMMTQVEAISRQLGIHSLLEKYPYEISGGQKQRVAVARAIITKPEILLADEPTGALDSKSSAALLDVFDTINASGQTILMVTHSTSAASRAQRVLFIKDGILYNQIFKGDKSEHQMFQEISDTLTVMASEVN